MQKYQTEKTKNSRKRRLSQNSKNRSYIPSNVVARVVQDIQQTVGNKAFQSFLKPSCRPELSSLQTATTYALVQNYNQSQPSLGRIVQRSPMTDEQARIWNRRVVRGLEQAEAALDRRSPDYDHAMSLLQATQRTMRELERNFNLATLLGIQHNIATALRDIHVRGRYVQVDLISAQFEVRRMISARRLPSEQEAIWHRSVIQVIQEALDTLDRQPEPDRFRAQELIREAERNSQELTRAYSLSPRDLSRIVNYLRTAHEGLALGGLGNRPLIATRIALMDARRLPSYQGAIP